MLGRLPATVISSSKRSSTSKAYCEIWTFCFRLNWILALTMERVVEAREYAMITFNDDHLQSRIFLGQIKGGGGTHDPATDNNDVITLLAVHGLAFSLSVA
jgi:hypothetical protein